MKNLLDKIMEEVNDKNLVIAGTVFLGTCSLFYLGMDSKEIVMSIISGLFGMAVGQKIKWKNIFAFFINLI